MERFDAAVIGGGMLGCFAARHLRRWNISTVLVEASADVCTGVSKANTAIVYPGYDNKPGSLKAALTVAGNAAFDSLCEELEVPFSRCGSLMVSYGPRGDSVLQKKYAGGLHNGVSGLRLLTGAEALAMEPMLADDVTSALYAPTAATVNPWQLGIAAYENAVDNGCVPLLNTRVLGIRKGDGGYVLETGRGEIHCRVVLNCAGLRADQVQELLFPPSVRIFPDGADYFILDRHAAAPTHIIFHEPEEKGKGLTAVPTVDGNLLLGPSRRPLAKEPSATAREGLAFLREICGQILPGVDLDMVIRSFAAVRPNPHRVVEQAGSYVPDGKGIGDFVIEHPAPGFWSLVGVKTPGLTCADGLGQHLARKAAACLDAPENPAFDPRRRAILQVHKLDFKERAKLAAQSPNYTDILCQCEDVSRAEVLEAIRRGAVDADGVKRRLGSGMGRCQGSRCSYAIEKLLEEYRHGEI